MKKLALTVLFVFALSSVALAAPLMDYEKGKVGFDYTYRPNASIDGSLGFEGSKTTIYKGYEDSAAQAETQTANQYWSGSFDGKANLDWGITVGLGKKFAVQYRGYNTETDTYSYDLSNFLNPGVPEASRMQISENGYDNGYYDEQSAILSIKNKVKTEEFNVLYKLGKNVSAFTGVVRANTKFSPSFSADSRWGYSDGCNYAEGMKLGFPSLASEDKNMWHIGLVGVAPIAKKTNLFGIVSVGNDYRNWEAGVSYAVAKDWEFNVNYRNMKIDKLSMGSLNMYDTHQHYGEGSAVTYQNDTLISGTANVKDVTVKGWGFGLSYKF